MKDIDKILDRYFKGETSLQEEQILRDYFNQSDIKEGHKSYAPMFNFFSQEQKGLTKEIRNEKSKNKYLSVWISIAASIALLVGAYFAFSSPLKGNGNQSIVYIDGEKSTDINIINSEALISIENISDMNEDILDAQIDILDSFTE